MPHCMLCNDWLQGSIHNMAGLAIKFSRAPLFTNIHVSTSLQANIDPSAPWVFVEAGEITLQIDESEWRTNLFHCFGTKFGAVHLGLSVNFHARVRKHWSHFKRENTPPMKIIFWSLAWANFQFDRRANASVTGQKQIFFNLKNWNNDYQYRFEKYTFLRGAIRTIICQNITLIVHGFLRRCDPTRSMRFLNRELYIQGVPPKCLPQEYMNISVISYRFSFFQDSNESPCSTVSILILKDGIINRIANLQRSKNCSSLAFARTCTFQNWWLFTRLMSCSSFWWRFESRVCVFFECKQKAIHEGTFWGGCEWRGVKNQTAILHRDCEIRSITCSCVKETASLFHRWMLVCLVYIDSTEPKLKNEIKYVDVTPFLGKLCIYFTGKHLGGTPCIWIRAHFLPFCERLGAGSPSTNQTIRFTASMFLMD